MAQRQTTTERQAAMRAKVEELRRKERAAARRRRLIGWGSAVLGALIVAAIIVAVVAWPRKAQPAPAAAPQIIPAGVAASPITVPPAVSTATNHSGIPGVLAWDTTGWPGNGQPSPGALEHDHVTGPVRYHITPPVGGPHNAIWMNAGVYTKPVPTERAVHNMEHGAVWITYDPDLPKSQIAQLTSFVGRQTLISEPSSGVAGQANRYVDLTPWASNTLPSPIVISAWGYQLRVSKADDPRLQKFVDTFRHNPTYTPEYGAAVDGIPVQTGGVPAAFGSTKPNPPGTAG